MHQYFKNKLIGKIFFGLFLLSILSLIIVPSNVIKLISFLLIFVFLILSLVFLTKGISYNKEEEKVLKEDLDNKNKDMVPQLIGFGAVLLLIIVISTLKSKSWSWNLLIPISLGVFVTLLGLYLKKKYNKNS